MFKSSRNRSRCETTARRQSASSEQTELSIAAGKADATRWTASARVEVSTVASTRWPVSDALKVRRIVSGSRISPTISTSRVFAERVQQRLFKTRRVAPNLALRMDASRERNVYSIGLSTVMMH